MGAQKTPRPTHRYLFPRALIFTSLHLVPLSPTPKNVGTPERSYRIMD